MRSLRGAGVVSELAPPDELLSLLVEPVEVLASGDDPVDGVLVVEEFVAELVGGFIVVLADELVEDGMLFGSFVDCVAAPLPGDAAVLALVAALPLLALLSLFADCEWDTPTAAVSAAAKAIELQVRDLFIQNSRGLEEGRSDGPEEAWHTKPIRGEWVAMHVPRTLAVIMSKA